MATNVNTMNYSGWNRGVERRHPRTRRHETENVSFIRTALAGVALAATFWGSMYFLSRAGSRMDARTDIAEALSSETQVEQVEQTESMLAEDSLATRAVRAMGRMASKKIVVEPAKMVEDKLPEPATEVETAEQHTATEAPITTAETNQNRPAKPTHIKTDGLSYEEAVAKEFIYRMESGNNPLAVNPKSKACGLGQALPCEKLTKDCDLNDYDCQDRWFENYREKRYGTWQNAKNHWQASVDINGQEVGHWW